VLRRIHGIPLPILVDVADLRYFPDLVGGRFPRPRDTVSGSDEPDARTPRRPINVKDLGGHQGSPAPLGWIVFPSFQPGETTRLEPVGSSEALFGLMQAMLNVHVWADRALILFRELVETVPVVRLVVGSLPDAADLLEDLPAEVARSG
jgi:hypothetical protein